MSNRIQPCEVCETDSNYVAACKSGGKIAMGHHPQHRLCPWCISWLNLLLERGQESYPGDGCFVLCPKLVSDAERVLHAMGGHTDVSDKVIEQMSKLGWPTKELKLNVKKKFKPQNWQGNFS